MPQTPQVRLNELLTQSNHPLLAPETSEKFAAYLTLLQKWNAKTNLTAIRDEEGILNRHFLESSLCASILGSTALSAGIHTLLDFGSGAGFPGIPIALMRPEIQVTLAESQNKKAAFLREAVRVLGLNTKVHTARAEELDTQFDCVTLRAVDNMAAAIPAAIQLLKPEGQIAILTTQEESFQMQRLATQPLDQHGTKIRESIAIDSWQSTPIPSSESRILLVGRSTK
jgi:16S rRNA (guanine527-N7)-methyltransferase